jgi:16S rRNA (guanine966-N2)-methyltransferase
VKLAAGVPIRPTPDRVRETLFNWLQPTIRGARCLDLFAGSGALGLEALSRGAREVVFVDRDARAIRQISSALQAFAAPPMPLHVADSLAFLRGPASPFDVVFLDPPFASGLLANASARLEGNGWLAANALIYIEAAHRDGPPTLPASWRLAKAKRAGEVGYYLVEGRRHADEQAQ